MTLLEGEARSQGDPSRAAVPRIPLLLPGSAGTGLFLEHPGSSVQCWCFRALCCHPDTNPAFSLPNRLLLSPYLCSLSFNRFFLGSFSWQDCSLHCSASGPAKAQGEAGFVGKDLDFSSQAAESPLYSDLLHHCCITGTRRMLLAKGGLNSCK